MSDPRQEFLDVLERAVQHVPHFTTPTTVPSDMSWGMFFDSSEILAAWLALDEKDRAESVIAAVTGYINRVNEMATEGKELCARVALQYGDEKRAAGLYGITPAAVTGGTPPPLQLVPESEEDGGEGDGEQGEANDLPRAGVELPDSEAFDIGAALRARYPGVPGIDHATLDDAVDLLQVAARAVAAGIDLETMVQAAAEPDELEGDSAEANHGEAIAGSVPGHRTPDLTAGLVHAAETAREAADLLHAAAMRLDAYSRMTSTTAAIEPEIGDSEPDPGPGFESDVEGETATQPGASAEPGSRTSGHGSDVDPAPEPDPATSAESASSAGTMTDPDPDPESCSRPITVIDATWSEPEPTASSNTRGAPSARSPKAQPPTGLSADIGRYVPRWQLHLVATAAITMAIVAMVLWARDPSPPGPAPLAPSRPQSGEPRTVTVEPPTTPPTPGEHVAPLPPAAPPTGPGNEGIETVVSSEQPSWAIIDEMDHPDEPVAEPSAEYERDQAVVSDDRARRSGKRPTDDRPARPIGSSLPSDRMSSGEAGHVAVNEREASEPAIQPRQERKPPAEIISSLIPHPVELRVPMGTKVEIQPADGSEAFTVSVQRKPSIVGEGRESPMEATAIHRVPVRTKAHPAPVIKWHDRHGSATMEVAAN